MLNVFIVNAFHATVLFLYPLKTSEKHRFPDVFKRYRKRSVARNGMLLIDPKNYNFFVFLLGKNLSWELNLCKSQSLSQPAFTCSMLGIETLEQGVKCSKLTTKTPEHVIGDVLVSLLLTLNIFHTLF